MCFPGQACWAAVCPFRPTWGHPSVPESETLPEAKQPPLVQILSRCRAKVGPVPPPRPLSPRTLCARAAPGCSPGTGESCTLHTMCVHVLIHVQAYVSVGAAPTGTGGGGGWWGVCPSVPGLTIQMAPFTKLLPVPLPESGSYFQALFPKLGGGEAPEGLPQLLCGSPQGRAVGGAWRVSPSLSSAAGGPWEGCCLPPPGLCKGCSCGLGCPSPLVSLANSCSPVVQPPAGLGLLSSWVPPRAHAWRRASAG